jgi:ABC-type Fe2+-enterobactin transport system substrate-binding protein
LKTLQQKLDAIHARLVAKDITLEEALTAINAACAANEAKAEANRQALLLKQQQQRDLVEERRLYMLRCAQPYIELIAEAKRKQNEPS